MDRCRRGRRVSRRERRLPAQPLRDDFVRVVFPDEHERAAESLDVRALPRLARDQALGEDPRFVALPRRDVGVGQLRPRTLERRVELTRLADLDEARQRRECSRSLCHVFLERRGRRAVVPGSNRRVGGKTDDLETGGGFGLGD